MDNGGYNYYSGTRLLQSFEFQNEQTLSIRENGYRVLSVDGKKQEITLLNRDTNEEFSENFEILVDATGAQHKITSMIGKNSDQLTVDYTPLNTPRHNAFGKIVFKVANPTSTLESNPISAGPVGATLLVMSDLPILKQLGWDQDYLPLCLLIYSAENQEIYFTGEVPKHFLDGENETERQGLLSDWATAIINIAYCRNNRSLRSLEKTKKDGNTMGLSTTSLCSVYSQSPKHANRNVIELSKGGAFFIIGGAFLQQNSLLGNELKSVLGDANAIPFCFDERGKLRLSPMFQRQKESVKEYKKLESDLKSFLEEEQENVLKRQPLLGKKAFVIGMGLGGYTAAMALLGLGFSVTLLDKRDDKTLYARPHGIFMKPGTTMRFFALTKLPTFGVEIEVSDVFTLTLKRPSQEQFDLMSDEDRLDFEFFKLLERSRSVVAINKIQQYQEQKLRYIMDNRGYKICSVEAGEVTFKETKFSKDQELSIYKGEYQVVGVDGENQKITFLSRNTNEEVSADFDVLVDASGSQHEITSMIGENNKKFKVDYTPLVSPRHNAFGAAILEVANPMSELVDNPLATPLVGKKLLEPKDLLILKKLGWDQDYLPLSFLKYTATADEKEIYFTGEVPKHFLECKDKNEQQRLLKEWASTITTLGYARDKGLRSLDDVRKLNGILSYSVTSLCSVFSQSPKYANTNVVSLPKGGLFCIVGDAFLPANFLFGHGLESVLRDIEALTFCFDDDGKFVSTSAMLKQKDERVTDYIKLDEKLKWLLEIGQKENALKQKENALKRASSPQLFQPNSGTSTAVVNRTGKVDEAHSHEPASP